MWECAIEGCGERTETAEELLLHQATAHEPVRCAVCGTTVADGYFAMRHTASEHTRTQYLRAYDADREDLKRREAVLERVEAEADVASVLDRLRDE
jgi:DNA-directed RNA polymerase subunit N (RpoN/RPB10)